MSVVDQINHDRIVENRIKLRFESQLTDLKAVGFTYLNNIETVFSLPHWPLAFNYGIGNREVWQMDGLFRVKWLRPLMLSSDKMTLAYPIPGAVRYYTFFESGFAIRTSAAQEDTSSDFESDADLYVENIPNQPIADSWTQHLAFCKQHIQEGRLPIPLTSADRLTAFHASERTVPDELFVAFCGWGQIAVSVSILCYYVVRWTA